MQQVRWRVLLVMGVAFGALYVVVTQPLRLGLDLRGGTQIVLEAQDTESVVVDGEVTARSLEVLRRRVDALGVAEPTIQQSGDRRIIVELPGVDDPDEAVEVIGRTAQLTFHPVLALATPAELNRQGAPNTDSAGEGEGGAAPGTSMPPAAEPAGDDRPPPPRATTPPIDPTVEQVIADTDGNPIRIGPAAFTGEALSEASASLDNLGRWEINLGWRDDTAWREMTATAACAPAGDPRRRAAIILDNEVLTSPAVDRSVPCGVGISGAGTRITGSFSENEAKNLATFIQGGSLPVPIEIVEQRTIGPTLGEAAIRASVVSIIIGASLTLVFLLIYYRFLGLLASVALVVYGLISLAALQLLGAALTLPGIAGFVLSVGMAVDGNVLVFERFKDEHAAGRTLRSAARAGFDRAWSAIADANVTTLIAALLLYLFAAGAVRGFGVTLSIGVIASMFSALVVTRLLINLTITRRRLSSPRLWGMGVGARLRTWAVERGPNVAGARRLCFAACGLAVVVAMSGVFVRGLDFGLEFTGGRLMEYEADGGTDLNVVRERLAGEGFARAIVQQTGEGNVAVRTSVLSDQDEASVDQAVREVVGETRRVRDEFVGPTIGDEIRQRALIALALALAAQLVYLAIRFRWTYGASSILALVHDVAIVVGIFAWLGKELDGVFLAALMTVIGYSVNDSVVVFDRIRERWRASSREPFSVAANQAVLETLPRTINTGLSTLFILFALWLLGGDTLADFALALILGIVAGTYSTVFLAMPLATVLERSPVSKGRRAPRAGGSAPAPDDRRTGPAEASASTGPSSPRRPASRPVPPRPSQRKRGGR